MYKCSNILHFEYNEKTTKVHLNYMWSLLKNSLSKYIYYLCFLVWWFGRSLRIQTCSNCHIAFSKRISVKLRISKSNKISQTFWETIVTNILFCQVRVLKLNINKTIPSSYFHERTHE